MRAPFDSHPSAAAPLARWSVLVVGLLAGFVCGCLSNPTPHPAGDNGDQAADATGRDETGGLVESDTTSDLGPEPTADTSDVDAAESAGDTAVDTAVDAALDTTDETGEAFPPAGRPINLREIQVVDLDADGHMDLLMMSCPKSQEADADAWGIYVFFDADTRADFARSDLFIQTRPVPDGVLVANVLGASAPELAVFGQRGDQGFLAVYPFEGRVPQTPLVRESPLGFVPKGGTNPIDGAPVGLAALDATGDGVVDIVAYDLYNLALFSAKAWTSSDVLAGKWTTLTSPETWVAILRVFPVRHDGGEWLAISTQYGRTHYFPLVEGVLDPNDIVVETGIQQHGTVVVDLDGDDVVEVVGFRDSQLTAKSFVAPTSTGFIYPMQMPISSGSLNDMVIGDIDDSGTLDIVAIETPQTGGHLQVGPDIALDGSDIRTSNWRSTNMPIGVEPYRLAIVGTGPAARVWAFDLDGSGHCFAWDGDDNRLARCR